MDYRNNLLKVVKTLYNRRRYIIGLSVGVAILTALISLLLPDYYRATTVFLAGSPDQANPQLLFGKGSREAGYFGNDNDNDRILTLSKSNELINFLVDSFNLYEHYDINPKGSKAGFKVQEEFLSHYDIIKTNRDAIELSIEDTDKELSAQMANAARNKIDQMIQNLIKNTQKKALETYEESIDNQQKLVKFYSDSLVGLRSKYGIYNSVGQGNQLTSELSQTEDKLVFNEARLLKLRKMNGIKRDTINKITSLIAGLETKRDSLKSKLSRFNEGMPKVNTIALMYFQSNESITQDMETYEVLKSTYEANIPSLIVVEEAAVPIVKDRPRRSIIVIAAGLLGFLFSVIGVLLFETYKSIDWKQVLK